jgi:transposase
MQAYSLDFRQKIMQVYLSDGLSYRQLATRFSVSLSFIQRLMALWNQTGSLQPRPRKGAVSKVFPAHAHTLTQLVRDYPDATLAELCDHFFEHTQYRVSAPSMCRWLQRLKLTLKKRHLVTPRKTLSEWDI